ncbi:hypothetical protein JYT23_00475 [Mariprofundus ferrooxydans]|nr:hypothetical protein [Mariprofundus ferrooxydans]
MNAKTPCPLFILCCFFFAHISAVQSVEPDKKETVSQHALQLPAFKRLDVTSIKWRWLEKYIPQNLSQASPKQQKTMMGEWHRNVFSAAAYSVIELWRHSKGELWWAFYREGERLHVWRFDAVANPYMAQYKIDGLEDLDGMNRLLIHIRADQFRNGGRWQLSKKTFYLQPQTSGIHFDRLENNFSFINAGYASEGVDGGKQLGDMNLTVSVEKRSDRSIVVKESKPTAAALKLCGFTDPMSDDDFDASTDHLNEAAHCLTKYIKGTKPFPRAAAPCPATTVQQNHVAPPFALYASDAMYQGSVAEVVLADERSHMFRTRLQNAMKQSVNFGGEYVLTSWGCGSGCVDGAVVSLKTGKVVFLPATIHAGYMEAEPLQFRDNSRLLIMSGTLNEVGKAAKYFYEFSGNEFLLLKSEAVNIGRKF